MKNTAILAKPNSDKDAKRISLTKIAGSKDLSQSAIGEKAVFVTQPALPPLDKFMPYLEEIWASRRVTNKGRYQKS